MPNILNKPNLDGIFTQFDKAFNDGLSTLYEAFGDWKQFTTEYNVNTEQVDFKFITELPKLEEWVDERRVYGIKAGNFVVPVKKWSTNIGISRDNLEDDTLGIALARIMGLSESMAQGVEEQLYAKLEAGATDLCFDGSAFFAAHTGGTNFDDTGGGYAWYLMDTTKLNFKSMVMAWRQQPRLTALTNPEASDHVWKFDEYLYGVDARFVPTFGFWQTAFRSKQPLNGTNLAEAEKVMMKFTDDKGRPLGIRPNLLVVSPENVYAAQTLLNADLIADGTNYVSNVMKGRFKFVSSAYLTLN